MEFGGRLPWCPIETMGGLNCQTQRRAGNKVVLETWAPEAYGSSLGALLVWTTLTPQAPSSRCQVPVKEHLIGSGVPHPDLDQSPGWGRGRSWEQFTIQTRAHLEYCTEDVPREERVLWAEQPPQELFSIKAHRHIVLRWSPLKFPFLHYCMHVCLYFYIKLFFYHTKQNEQKFFHLI